ncbi:MAG: hypothetical protein EB127_05625 [Alphaproteobacteria bacterium]|nr:hypothetical protein [Alphaproteobacteria bacterium]
METCKAVIQEGPRKGNSCKFPPNDNGYCGRHLRNKEYDDGIEAGKTWCRFFFRGCNNEAKGSCEDCKKTLSKKTLACKHEGCKFKVMEGDFCKKHDRDKYYIEEKEKGIKYCDIARGCFNLLKDKKSCDTCLDIQREKDAERYAKRKDIIKATEIQNTIIRSCIKCTRDFDVFKTKFNKDSMHCLDCTTKQNIQDKKREGRERNYMKEHLKNLENHYRNYIVSSTKRGHGDFQLNFEEFQQLVTKPCHYCNLIKEDEANGIDRVNNDIGYTKENCVPACWRCNRMKHFYHPEFFLEKCKIITKKLIPTKEFYTKWATYYTRTNNRNYTTYKREAEETRKLPFEITQEQWDWLTRSPCYLCGYQDAHGIGLDRQDNTIRKYTLENCRPCCGSCNSMKGEIPLQEFLEQCKLVASSQLEFKEIPEQKNPLKEAEDKGHLMNAEDRTHWKSKGLYYAILSDTALAFQQSYNDVFTLTEFNELCLTVKASTKETALSQLKDVLGKLKKRKYRLNRHVNDHDPKSLAANL